jgi:prepilin-type N-terminal cleavage/methylation domain-containing protein
MNRIEFNSRGFTLIEMLVVVAILGVIMGAMSMTINTLYKDFDIGSNHSLAKRQVEQAGYFLSKDIQMAYSVNTTIPFVSMYCYTGVTADTLQTVSYSLSGGNLTRTDSLGSTVVAQYIDAANSSISASNNSTYILNITAMYPYPSGTTQNGTYRIQQRAP